MKALAFFITTVLAVVSVTLLAADIELAVAEEGIKIPAFLVGPWSGESGLIGPYAKGPTSYEFKGDGSWDNKTTSARPLGAFAFFTVSGRISTIKETPEGMEILLDGKYNDGVSRGAPVRITLKKVSDEKLTGTGMGAGGAFELTITKVKEAEKKQ